MFFPTDTLPPWPTEIPRVFRPVAKLKYGIQRYSPSDLRAIEKAAERMESYSAIKCSALTGTWTENIFRNHADYTDETTASGEKNLLNPLTQIPTLPALFFDQVAFRAISFLARGIFSNTGTPTITFNSYFCTAQNLTSAWSGSGVSIGQSAAITTASSPTNAAWECRLDLVCNTSGQQSGNTTLNCCGYVSSPAQPTGGTSGFASPFIYALTPSASNSTWTATIDDSVTQYFYLTKNFSATGTHAVCKYLRMDGLN